MRNRWKNRYTVQIYNQRYEALSRSLVRSKTITPFLEVTSTGAGTVPFLATLAYPRTISPYEVWKTRRPAITKERAQEESSVLLPARPPVIKIKVAAATLLIPTPHRFS
ncbi:hypothetical protein J6590_005551 [Homalodisca vitripennis]|nr:hypothetical protein J6590_005551 [Homalodisca vitripennis]